MPRRRWPYFLVAILIGSCSVLWFFYRQGLERSDQWSSVGGFILSAISLLLGLRPASMAHGDLVDTSALADRLAEVVQDQWRREQSNQDLHRFGSLAVRWAVSNRAGLRDRPEKVFGPAASAQNETAFHGMVADVAHHFLALPRQRLVVLGEPGSGKSVLAARLLLDLLDDRQSAQPVPVLLPVRTWDPSGEHLDDWIVRELAALYYGRNERVPRQLLLAGVLLPILDGLDEISEANQPQALGAIDRATGGRRPVVVTSRIAPYQRMVDESGFLVAAAVTEIAPLSIDDIVSCLEQSAPVGDTSWDPVVHDLRAHPTSPLAGALSTPFMVYLCQTAYGNRQAPATLIDRVQHMGSRQDVERHLVKALVPARYTNHPAPAHAQPRRAYSTEQAERWLGYLAQNLQRSGTRDLAWWKLAQAVPRAVLGTFFLVGGGSLLGLAAAALFGPGVGITIGILGGVFFGFGGEVVEAACRLFGQRIDRSHPVPVHAVLHHGGRTRLFAGTFVAGGVGGSGFALALLAWDRVGPFWGVLVILLALLACLVMVTGLGDVLRGPVHLTDLTPQSILSSDRTTATLRAAGMSTGVALGILTLTRSDIGIVSAVGFGLVAALSGYADSAWGFFFLSRVWLALTGRLPFRLMAFLEDAYQRGVLRQYGPVYQFRHQHLQESLAGP
ncbi:NACHT domain-containing protein (plasmid) [Streptomyces sp. NBC_00053]|uniref:NACHT domain-containing protein n=1 Tax=unclassified Streptomyces TaxID=2593676 RepID=UPI002250D02B|nr:MULTISPECIES: NACHT domain-containing protein [unclassified Streptomyces]MCX4399940.1 NACHT domain-containing protein [Streptomyces sp. NBC_01767]MCX5506056.1 NACHT domain-containing protein [Streptomyces sp. NBC_00052]MCX5554289.1 NACHT domain-containing protein [Streptomyces sp. NBC_00051]WSP52959.1 NACHT domain-containing protein [Streptomyces sp. NBC_01243]